MSRASEIQGVVDKFYAIISGSAKEERNWNEFKSLFVSDDSSLTSIKLKDKSEYVCKRDLETYIVGLSNFLKKDDFYEYGLNYEVKIYGSIANVYSEYEAKRKLEDTSITKCGVCLVQLIYDGISWKIHSMLWQDKR